MTKSYQTAMRFLEIQTLEDLCGLLGIPIDYLIETLLDPRYTQYSVPKSKDKFVKLAVPGIRIREIQRMLLPYLNVMNFYLGSSSSYAFMPSLDKGMKPRNIIENARQHCGKKFVMNIDFSHFFATITYERIKKLFSQMPFKFTEAVASVLTGIVCFEEKLPIGACTSPAISNLVCVEMDVELEIISYKERIIYTRYADDLTFSANRIFPSEFLKKVDTVIDSYGFILNESKFKIRNNKQKQVVTGIKVNEKPNLDREYIRRIRAILHNWKYKNFEDVIRKYYYLNIPITSETISTFIKSIEGKINYIGQVRGKQDSIFLKLKGQFSDCIR